MFCLWRSQYKCQSRHKQHTKSHHYNCDGVVSGNLEHRETPKIADRPVWSRNGRRWIFASSRKRKTTFSASEAHCQDQDCSKLLSSNFLGEMGQRDGTDWGLQASHETGHDDDGQDLSSRFASSASLASCRSLGKLIKRANTFSFSLRLRSAFLSILSCSRFRSRCSRSRPRRTRSLTPRNRNWRKPRPAGSVRTPAPPLALSIGKAFQPPSSIFLRHQLRHHSGPPTFPFAAGSGAGRVQVRHSRRYHVRRAL